MEEDVDGGLGLGGRLKHDGLEGGLRYEGVEGGVI